MLTRINSWLRGYRIGQKRYLKDSPFGIGEFVHFLPREMWSDSEKRRFYLCFIEEEWNGWRWRFVRNVQRSIFDIERRGVNTTIAELCEVV